MPAPPPESDVAIVRARGTTRLPSPVLTGSGSTGVISAPIGHPGTPKASVGVVADRGTSVAGAAGRARSSRTSAVEPPRAGQSGAVPGRPRPARRLRARRAGDHRALHPPGRGVGGAPRRRQRDRHDEHREREEPRVQPARARPARARAEEPRALPLPDEGARAGSGARAAGVRRQGRQAGDLRRRHRDRAALADPQVGERRPDQPGHAPRRRAAAPRPLGRRAREPALRRRRRGARLPRRLRLARRRTSSAGCAGSRASTARSRSSCSPRRRSRTPRSWRSRCSASRRR